MLYEAEGKLYEKFETQQVSDNFKKREFVLEIEDGKFTNHIKFQLTQQRCDLLDHFEKGRYVKLGFVLQGRPFTNKEGKVIYFTNLNVLKLEGAEGEADTGGEATQNYDPNRDIPPEEEGESLPF